jgi:hypothetical protein
MNRDEMLEHQIVLLFTQDNQIKVSCNCKRTGYDGHSALTDEHGAPAVRPRWDASEALRAYKLHLKR